MGRWRRHLDPKVKRDLWTPQEDERLTQMVGQLGAQWSRICRHVKNRTAQQCRARCAPPPIVAAHRAPGERRVRQRPVLSQRQAHCRKQLLL